MRTKTLLLAAALTAAGIASSLAQSNVYSINVVGYVNVVCSNGFTPVTTPLIPSNGTVSNLLNAYVGLGDEVLTFVGGGYVTYNRDEFTGNWADITAGHGNTNADNLILPVGTGYFIHHTASAQPITVTYVGEVSQGVLVNTPSSTPKISFLGSKVPQGGFAEDLGIVPGLGDQITRFQPNGAGSGRLVDYENDEFANTWSQLTGGGAYGVTDSAKGPTINVAEGFFYKNNSGTATWTRSFTVQ